MNKMIVKKLNALVDEVRREEEWVEKQTNDITNNNIKMCFDKDLVPVTTFEEDDYECCILEGMSW